MKDVRKMMGFDLQFFENLTPQCQGKVVYHDVVGSTNDEARKEILSGQGVSGSIYITEFQTKGRGRGGHKWFCQKGEGLLFSLVIDPDEKASLWYRMSLAIGVAIVIVLQDLGVEAELKWPNDVYIDEKKVAGILIENINDLLIVGIGLNVNAREFPEIMAVRATSLSRVLGEDVNREILLANLVSSIFKVGSLIGEGFEYLIERMMECFYLKNKRVSMVVKGETVVCEVLGVNENGYLLVKKDEELVEIRQASEIKLLE